jgi:16S rRNA A1518/A1519 N6-dimethyltransferase RsmA/KsgA/DIM1 with predicted DNA glycosylase/AP lyase activity
VPIPKAVEENILEALKLGNESVLYDLGCGDGRVLLRASEKYPSARCIGVEKSVFPFLLAKFYTRKYKNITIKREDIFKTDVPGATHIFIYLFPQVLEKLLPILKEKCKAGTRIVSCDFENKNWQSTEIIPLPENNSGRGKRLVIYRI